MHIVLCRRKQNGAKVAELVLPPISSQTYDAKVNYHLRIHRNNIVKNIKLLEMHQNKLELLSRNFKPI